MKRGLMYNGWSWVVLITLGMTTFVMCTKSDTVTIKYKKPAIAVRVSFVDSQYYETSFDNKNWIPVPEPWDTNVYSPMVFMADEFPRFYFKGSNGLRIEDISERVAVVVTNQEKVMSKITPLPPPAPPQ